MEVLGVPLTVWNCVTAWVVICTSYIIYDWLRVLAWRRKYHLKGPFPLPFFGNFLGLIGKDVEKTVMEARKRFGPIYASNVGAINMINLSDFDLMKKIFIKEHVQFQNRFSMRELDPSPMDVTLLALRDSDWKRVRNIVTPTFSPGKIKLMTEEINFCADCLVQSLNEPAISGDTIEIRYQVGCFSMDVIAGTAFGIRTQAHANPEQPFVYHAKKVFGQSVNDNPLVLFASRYIDVNSKRRVKNRILESLDLRHGIVGNHAALFAVFFPTASALLAKLFGISFFFPKDSIKFFSDVIEKIMEERKMTNKTDRADMIGLLMTAQDNEEQHVQNTSKKLSKAELMAMGFIAFVAGYDTTSSLLTFFAYAMATHPEIQDKLVDEINRKYPSDKVQVKYEDLVELPYLDQVISETLRMYPPLARMNRVTSNDKDVLLDGQWFPRKTMIDYSIWNFHHDENLYEDPEAFKPERFSPEEKQKRDPVAFMPFGHGPRNCIGMRLALLEAKIAVIHVLKKLKFVRTQETEEPLELLKMESFLRTKNPIKLGVKLHKDA